MTLTLEQALDTSQALEERLAAISDTNKRAALEQKKAMVDFAAFGLFKQAGMNWTDVAKPLAWGAGIGLPALGVGHLLARDARQQGEELIDHARNQALLTALGIGGMQGIGNALSSALRPNKREETTELSGPNDQSWLGRNTVKMSADAVLQKLAAVLLLDGVLEAQAQKLAGDERSDALECLFLNRTHGTRLLRELLR